MLATSAVLEFVALEASSAIVDTALFQSARKRRPSVYIYVSRGCLIDEWSAEDHTLIRYNMYMCALTADCTRSLTCTRLSCMRQQF